MQHRTQARGLTGAGRRVLWRGATCGTTFVKFAQIMLVSINATDLLVLLLLLLCLLVAELLSAQLCSTLLCCLPHAAVISLAPFKAACALQRVLLLHAGWLSTLQLCGMRSTPGSAAPVGE